MQFGINDLILGWGQYRNAVASGQRCSSNNELMRIETRRYRVTVLTRPQDDGSRFH